MEVKSSRIKLNAITLFLLVFHNELDMNYMLQSDYTSNFLFFVNS